MVSWKPSSQIAHEVQPESWSVGSYLGAIQVTFKAKNATSIGMLQELQHIIWRCVIF